jgi:hypothetical protein
MYGHLAIQMVGDVHPIRLFERSEFAARPEHALLPHFIEWMVAWITHPVHLGFDFFITHTRISLDRSG